MAAGDVYHLVAKALSQNSVYMNTLAVQTLAAADPDATARQLLADDFKTIWVARQNSLINWTTWELRQLWGDGMSIGPGSCKRSGGVVFGAPFSAPLQGAMGPADMLPPQCALVVTLSTGLIGRAKRGRWYAFGWGEGDQANGVWTSGHLANMTAALTTFFNKYKSGGTSPAYQLGVWSERIATGCVPNPNGPGHIQVDSPKPDQAFTPVTGYTLRATVYSQRRRTLGVGR